MIRSLLPQVLEIIGNGVMVVDSDGRVDYWNRWMGEATGVEREDAEGRTVFELFPGMREKAFRRNLKSVIAFGNFAFFSQKVHGAVFPMPCAPGAPEGFDRMQQSCRMGPLRHEGEVCRAFVVIEDVTEAVSNERRLAEAASRDGLTGAYNRRWFDRRMEDEFDRARRYGRGPALLILDIDHFKSLNDEEGHQFGDEALKRVAEICRHALRSTDALCRYGGEEFCAVLPETELGQGVALAERLRTSCASSPIAFRGAKRSLTVSSGVSAWREGDDVTSLVGRADAALYVAKRAGRNRVEVGT
ncbi:MAG: diguanylate cyclase [Spirochaetales bacterium]|nr:diguanylate cyclase [Spirochaetales bacterium]